MLLMSRRVPSLSIFQGLSPKNVKITNILQDEFQVAAG